MVNKLDKEYITIKTKVFIQTIMSFLPYFLYSCIIICLISLGMMLSFDFFLNTGLSVLKFIECIAVYFIIMELVPYIKKLVIFK